ncbi:MAG: hypothetical protein DID90_2727552692 [Candidatus Nitrotoga sp. LAW]|nr:MAG: hypothetical protein DID90_2727552692 [Candidatus Nitrotoga sp. LAW]
MVGFTDNFFQIAQHAECWVLRRFPTHTAVHNNGGVLSAAHRYP